MLVILNVVFAVLKASLAFAAEAECHIRDILFGTAADFTAMSFFPWSLSMVDFLCEFLVAFFSGNETSDSLPVQDQQQRQNQKVLILSGHSVINHQSHAKDSKNQPAYRNEKIEVDGEIRVVQSGQGSDAKNDRIKINDVSGEETIGSQNCPGHQHEQISLIPPYSIFQSANHYLVNQHAEGKPDDGCEIKTGSVVKEGKGWQSPHFASVDDSARIEIEQTEKSEGNPEHAERKVDSKGSCHPIKSELQQGYLMERRSPSEIGSLFHTVYGLLKSKLELCRFPVFRKPNPVNPAIPSISYPDFF